MNNLCHTHKTRFWYVLGVPFKISDDYRQTVKGEQDTEGTGGRN